MSSTFTSILKMKKNQFQILLNNQKIEFNVFYSIPLILIFITILLKSIKKPKNTKKWQKFAKINDSKQLPKQPKPKFQIKAKLIKIKTVFGKIINMIIDIFMILWICISTILIEIFETFDYNLKFYWNTIQNWKKAKSVKDTTKLAEVKTKLVNQETTSNVIQTVSKGELKSVKLVGNYNNLTAQNSHKTAKLTSRRLSFSNADKTEINKKTEIKNKKRRVSFGENQIQKFNKFENPKNINNLNKLVENSNNLVENVNIDINCIESDSDNLANLVKSSRKSKLSANYLHSATKLAPLPKKAKLVEYSNFLDYQLLDGVELLKKELRA